MNRFIVTLVALAVLVIASTAHADVFVQRTRIRSVQRPVVVRQQNVVVQRGFVAHGFAPTFVAPTFVAPQAVVVPFGGCQAFGSSAFFFGH